MTDPYRLLGVSPDATQAEIVHAYRRRVRDHHPDLHTENSQPGSNEQLHRILAAYALLRDPRRRADYERTHVARAAEGPVRIPITYHETSAEQAPLFAGPVLWQPSRQTWQHAIRSG